MLGAVVTVAFSVRLHELRSYDGLQLRQEGWLRPVPPIGFDEDTVQVN